MTISKINKKNRGKSATGAEISVTAPLTVENTVCVWFSVTVHVCVHALPPAGRERYCLGAQRLEDGLTSLRAGVTGICGRPASYTGSELMIVEWVLLTTKSSL